VERNTTYMFRAFFILGLILLFISLFVEWYSFHMKDFGNNLLVSWSYTIFTAWSTPLSSGAILNNAMKPTMALIPVMVNIILLVVITGAGYVVIIKNIDTAKELRNYNKFAYINIFLVLLTGFYVIICPIMYLAPNKLYFPLLTVIDYDLEYIYTYSIGLGYILQLISFPLIFPYCVFYYKTTSSFIQQERAPETTLQNLILESQEAVDLDKYIAEEELKDQKVSHISKEEEEELNPVLTTFMESEK
jgi:hypothetical protein